MIKVKVINNKTNIKFEKDFPNEYLADKFIIKVNKGKSLTYISKFNG